MVNGKSKFVEIVVKAELIFFRGYYHIFLQTLYARIKGFADHK